jgi:hypothetical protein
MIDPAALQQHMVSAEASPSSRRMRDHRGDRLTRGNPARHLWGQSRLGELLAQDIEVG